MSAKSEQIAGMMRAVELISPFDAIAELEKAMDEKDDFHLRFAMVDNIYQQTVANPEWRKEFNGITDAIFDPKILATLSPKCAMSGREGSFAIRNSLAILNSFLVDMGRHLIPAGKFIMAQNKLLEENGNREQYDDAVKVFMNDFNNGVGKLQREQRELKTGHVIDGTLLEFEVTKAVVGGNVDPLIRSEIEQHAQAMISINSFISQVERYILEGIQWNPSTASVYHEFSGVIDLRKTIEPLVDYAMEIKAASLMWCLRSVK